MTLGHYLTGDVMGCGILFPPDYDSEVDSDLSPDEVEPPHFIEDDDTYHSSDSEDDDSWLGGKEDESGTKVQVCILEYFLCSIISRLKQLLRS